MEVHNLYLINILLTTTLFFLIIFGGWIAFQLSTSKFKQGDLGTGPIEGALLGLLGLLIAFSFAGAQNRLNERRQVIIEETNSIGTAFLRLDLLNPEKKSELQRLFLQYIDSRIDFYKKLVDESAATAELKNTLQLQETIWNQIPKDESPLLTLPALNTMFDIVFNRTLAVLTHTSHYVIVLLYVIVIISAIVSGLGMARRNHFSWSHMILFSLAASLTIFIITDLEYPRVGLIQLDYTQRALLYLKESMIEHMSS